MRRQASGVIPPRRHPCIVRSSVPALRVADVTPDPVGRAVASRSASHLVSRFCSMPPRPRRSFPRRPSRVRSPATRPDRASRNYTYWATDIVLKNFGFVEEEFFFEGTANRYDAANPSGGVGNAARCTPIANVVSSNACLQVAYARHPADRSGQVQRDRHRRMDECDEWLRHAGLVAEAQGVLSARGLCVRRGVGAERRPQQRSPTVFATGAPTRYGRST